MFYFRHVCSSVESSFSPNTSFDNFTFFLYSLYIIHFITKFQFSLLTKLQIKITSSTRPKGFPLALLRSLNPNFSLYPKPSFFINHPFHLVSFSFRQFLQFYPPIYHNDFIKDFISNMSIGLGLQRSLTPFDHNNSITFNCNQYLFGKSD